MAEGITNAQKKGGGQRVISTATLTDAQRSISDTKYLEKGTWLVLIAESRRIDALPDNVETYDYSTIVHDGIEANIGGYINGKTPTTNVFRFACVVFVSTSQNVVIKHQVNMSASAYPSSFGSMSHTVELVKIG